MPDISHPTSSKPASDLAPGDYLLNGVGADGPRAFVRITSGFDPKAGNVKYETMDGIAGVMTLPSAFDVRVAWPGSPPPWLPEGEEAAG